MRKLLLFAGLALFIGLLVYTTSDSGVEHYELETFLRNKTSCSGKETVLYGYMDPLSVEKNASRIKFRLYSEDGWQRYAKTGKENESSLMVHLRGFLPDAMGLGQKIAVYGRSDCPPGVFSAHKVLARCSSKYSEGRGE